MGGRDEQTGKAGALVGGGEQKELLLLGCSGKYGCVKFVGESTREKTQKNQEDGSKSDPAEEKRRGSDQIWSLRKNCFNSAGLDPRSRRRRTK